MGNQGNVYKSEEAIKFQFVAEVELGVPSKKCKNFGICRIYPFSRMESKGFLKSDVEEACCNKKRVLESVVSVINNSHVEICFLKNNIDSDTLDNYFGDGKFKVEEDFFYADKKNKELEFKIVKGFYPVEINRTLVTVLFVN